MLGNVLLFKMARKCSSVQCLGARAAKCQKWRSNILHLNKALFYANCQQNTYWETLSHGETIEYAFKMFTHQCKVVLHFYCKQMALLNPHKSCAAGHGRQWWLWPQWREAEVGRWWRWRRCRLTSPFSVKLNLPVKMLAFWLSCKPGRY